MAETMAAGVEKEQSLRAAGFNDNEIQQWKDETANTLSQSGFSQKEVKEYFGIKEPDMAPVQEEYKKNLEEFYGPQRQPQSSGEVVAAEQAPQETAPKEAKSFLEAFEAGWKQSVTGLIMEGKKPDVVMSEHAPMMYRIASQVSTLAGDLPAMIAGGTIGAAIGGAEGSIVPGFGTAAGAAVVGAGGAFAMPAWYRSHLMQQYEKGEVASFSDAWERFSASVIEAQKGFITGAATAGVGGAVAEVAKPIASPLMQASAKAMSEVVTMTTVGAALEGKVPEPQEFLDAAILLGGMHGSVKVASKLRGVYEKTGIPLEQIVNDAQTNPTIRQDILSENKPIPSQYEKAVDPHFMKEPKKEKAAEPAKKEVEIPMDEANQKIRSQISEKQGKPGKEFNAKETFNQLYTDYVDKLDPIKRVVSEITPEVKDLTADKNPYVLFRTANDYKSKVTHAFEKGTIDFKTLETSGKSFKEIIEPHKNEMAMLENYAVAKRALELDARGIESGFDVAAAKSVVEAGKAKFEKASNELTEFQNRNLQYLRDSGRISEDAYTKITEANKSYVPFSRLVEQESGATGKPGTKSLKRIKGSELGIQSPIEAMLYNTEAVFKMAEKNRAVKSLLELDTKGEVFTEVKAEKTSIELKKSEIEKILKDNGMAVTPENIETAKIFREKQRPLAENEFDVYVDGVRKVYETTPEVAKAIKSLDGDKAATSMFMKLAKGISGAKRIGISLTPDFVAKNFFRDQITAGVFTEGNMVSFVDTVRAMGDLIKKNDVYYEWLKSGGGNATFLELNKKYLEKQIFKLNKETKFIDKAWNVVQKPIDFLKIAGSLAEHGTRLAEFKKVTAGKKGAENLIKGGFAAREITVDFSRMGAKMSALNSITAFMNVSVQGMDRTIRAMKADPKGVGMKAAAYITAPSLLLWYANHDDERYQNLPNWQKDLFWIIPTDDWQPVKDNNELQGLPEYLIKEVNGKYMVNKGTIYRIPKPQELGMLFGTVPERLLNQFFTDNPRALKDFGKTIADMVTPSLVPDVAAPVWEQKFNKSFFTGGAIVPGHLEKMLPEYRYTDYTSEAAKGLGKIIAEVPGIGSTSFASPMVIENYVRSWTGTLGMYGLQVLDKSFEAAGITPPAIKPTATLSDIPFIKSFIVRYPSAGTQPIIDFQERVKENQRVLNTFKSLAKENSPEYLAVLSEYEDKILDLSGMEEAIGKQNRAIQMIYKNEAYSSDDQRQMIDGLYYMMTEIAKQGNKIADEFEASVAKTKKDMQTNKGAK